MALDDAENPLQLLVRASDLQLSPISGAAGQKSSPTVSQQTAAVSHVGGYQGHENHDPGSKPFFIPARATRDVGSDIDPVELGLVTGDEAESLFSLYVVARMFLTRASMLTGAVFTGIWHTLDGALIPQSIRCRLCVLNRHFSSRRFYPRQLFSCRLRQLCRKDFPDTAKISPAV